MILKYLSVFINNWGNFLGAAFRTNSSDEDIELDERKSFDERLREALCQTVTKSGVTKGRKIGYLNALAKLWTNQPDSVLQESGLKFKEVLLW